MVISDHKRKAVILLSGGLDSSTTLAITKAEGYELYAISFDYNQRHHIELASAGIVASSLGVRKHMTIRFDLREIGGSALTSVTEIPKAKIKNKELSTLNLHPSSFIPATYVPARNTIFLSFALAWAEVLGAEDIFIGANAVDYSGYPDCRPEYLRAFENMANLATKESAEGKMSFRIMAPLISMRKSEIIKKGLELGLDYALTWSCYEPQPAKEQKGGCLEEHGISATELPGAGMYRPCGSCDSCLLREKGFREAGTADPLFIIYQ